MKKYNLFAVIALLLLLVILTGCGGNKPIRGKVTFAEDGSPLQKGVVTFQSETILARGNLKSDGTYIMGTDKETDGVPLGTYKVSVEYAFGVAPQPESDSILPSSPIMIPLITPLPPTTFTVDGKKKVYDIVVNKP